MKKIILTILFVLATTCAYADPYVSGQFGAAFQKDITNPFPINGRFINIPQEDSQAYGGAAGYDFGWWRAEFEGMYASHELTTILPTGDPDQPFTARKDDLGTPYYFVNAFADWRVLDNLDLYGGGGVDLGGEGYNLTIGAQALITDNWGVTASGRYLFTDDDRLDDMPMVMFGVRYTFD